MFTLTNQELRGTIFGSVAPRVQIPRLLRMHHEGNLIIDELITQEYSIDEVNQGYQDLEAGKNVRGIVRF
jgi:S-(hydroxymethyl)glutathione dehydrogenase/alcohol dehydrogenase